MKFVCSVLLLLVCLITEGLSLMKNRDPKVEHNRTVGRSGEEEEGPAKSIKKKLKEWRVLWNDLDRQSAANKEVKEAGNCTADDQLTHDYFLLNDLIYGQRGAGKILQWGWPRVTYYDSAFKGLHSVTKDIVFCDPYERDTCLNGKCVKCEELPTDAPQLLKDGCGFNRTGGKEAMVDPSKIKDIPGPLETNLTEGDCEGGWITEEFVKTAIKSFENTEGYRGHKTEHDCTYNRQLQEAFVTLKKLVKDGEAGLKERIDRDKQFYEDTFRVVKNGVKDDTLVCRYEKDSDGDGPFVCGPDWECIKCNKDEAKMFNKLCDWPEDPPKDYKKKKCGTTPTLATTEGRGSRVKEIGWSVLSAASVALVVRGVYQ